MDIERNYDLVELRRRADSMRSQLYSLIRYIDDGKLHRLTECQVPDVQLQRLIGKIDQSLD